MNGSLVIDFVFDICFPMLRCEKSFDFNLGLPTGSLLNPWRDLWSSFFLPNPCQKGLKKKVSIGLQPSMMRVTWSKSVRTVNFIADRFTNLLKHYKQFLYHGVREIMRSM
jgi:hypothetical protein